MVYNYLQRKVLEKWRASINDWLHCSQCGDTMEMGIFFPSSEGCHSKKTGKPLYAILAWGCSQIRREDESVRGHDFDFFRAEPSPALLNLLKQRKPMGWETVLNVFEEKSEP